MAGYRYRRMASVKENMMTKLGIDTYRKTLSTLRERIAEDASQLQDEALRTGEGEASGNLSHVPIHMADLGTDSFEQEFTLGLLDNHEQKLKEIDAALERIEQGTFGRCEECGKDLSKERLEALPFTRYCVECARNLQ